MDVFAKAQDYLEQKMPFVLFCSPNSENIEGVFQKNNTLYLFENQSGFVFSSFDGAKKYCIPAAFSEKITVEKTTFSFANSKTIEVSPTAEEICFFEKLVTKSVTTILEKKLDKVVISRNIEVQKEIEILDTYQNAIDTYPTAFCYLFFHPKIGMWLGATPEQLCKIEHNELETVALAGTQVFQENMVWEEKEQQEQQFVTDYLVQKTKPFLRNVQLSAPFTVKAGNLAHIKTILNGTVLETKNIIDLINVLHPTPAVCGLPKEQAIAFIGKNENYDRAFYSGFLGVYSAENQSVNLFVNLRCMQIIDAKPILYVGCGITKDSNPKKEFLETENKAQTMLSILVLEKS